VSWFGGFWTIRVSVDKIVGMVVVAVVGYCTVLNMVVGVTIFVRWDIQVLWKFYS
jgi:hypothetical protein